MWQNYLTPKGLTMWSRALSILKKMVSQRPGITLCYVYSVEWSTRRKEILGLLSLEGHFNEGHTRPFMVKAVVPINVMVPSTWLTMTNKLFDPHNKLTMWRSSTKKEQMQKINGCLITNKSAKRITRKWNLDTYVLEI